MCFVQFFYHKSLIDFYIVNHDSVNIKQRYSDHYVHKQNKQFIYYSSVTIHKQALSWKSIIKGSKECNVTTKK